MIEDDEDEDYEGLYEHGHWEWDTVSQMLVFTRNSPLEKYDETQSTQNVIGPIDFKDDLDLLEQQRFRKRFQRKVADHDVVQLQDVKDVVLFTAPRTMLTPAVVNIIHLSMTERFLRALIAYCQYYLQICDEMSRRMLELHVKVRTPKTDEVELGFRENLEDLRLLVAKEYCSIILGSSEFAKYHHMGLSKKSQSLSKKEALLFESVLRISTQIVWLALGRKSYNQIELEIHRLFKTKIFNIIEHKLKTKHTENLTPKELNVVFGHCVKQGQKLNTHSPLINEVFCERPIDYRQLGLGVIRYNRLSFRLRYLERLLIAPETLLEEMGVTLGILGLPRARFDTMLKEIKLAPNTASSTASMKPSQGILLSLSRATMSKTSRVSTGMRKSTANALLQKLYPDFYLPENEDETECLPDHFPLDLLQQKSCNKAQRKKWQEYVARLSARKMFKGSKGNID